MVFEDVVGRAQPIVVGSSILQAVASRQVDLSQTQLPELSTWSFGATVDALITDTDRRRDSCAACTDADQKVHQKHEIPKHYDIDQQGSKQIIQREERQNMYV